MNPHTKMKVFLTVGFILIGLSVIFASCFGLIFNKILYNALIIDEGKPIFDQFTAPSTPIYLDYYFFNVTNPDDIKNYGAKPILKEVGPYSYNEQYVKYDFVFDDPAGTVSYYQNTTYFFNKDKSNGTEQDLITTLNAVMVILGHKIDSLSPGLKAIGELLFLRFNLDNNLFITRSVSELLFKGYYDPFIDLMGQLTGDPTQSDGKFGFYLHLLAPFGYDNFLVKELLWPEIEAGMDLFETFTVEELLYVGWELPTFNYDFSNYPFPILNATSGLQGTLYEILSQLGIEVAYLEDNRISLFKGSNGTNDGLWEVNTGAKGMDEYLLIKEWRNSSTLNYWNDEYCDMINGTDGTQFPPGVTKDEVIRLYTSDLCRSLYLGYERDIVLQDAVSAYHFIPPPEMLMAPPGNEDNECYCVPVPSDVENCQGDSMLNLAPCSSGAPVILSTPHFYQGDGIELAKFDGLSPTKELHETFLDIEPTSGVVMAASKRIQLNLPLRRYGNLPSFRNVPEVIFPVLWADENAIISKEDADTFKKVLTLPFIVVYSICGVLILVGLVLVIYGFVMYKRLKREPKFEAIKK